MGKTPHKNWIGFTQIRNSNGIIYKALCNGCKKELVRRDSAALKAHRKSCKAVSGESENKSILNESIKDVIVVADNTSKKSNAFKEAESCDSSNVKVVNESHDKNEIDILLLKFLLSNNIEFEKLNTTHIQRFIHALNPIYIIPSKEQISDHIVNKAYTKIMDSLRSQNSNVLGVMVFKEAEKIYGVSYIINPENEYFYIHDTTFSLDEDQTKTEIENFFDASITKVKCMYNILIKYLVYEGEVKVSKSRTINENTYQVIFSFKTLINNLKYQHSPFSLSDHEDVQKYLNYNTALDELKEKVNSSKYSLADSTEDLLHLVDNNTLAINENAMDEIILFLSPVALLANFLTHSYKGRYITQYKSLTDMMYNYLFEYAPNEIFKEFSEYKDENGTFKLLFDPTKSFECKRFWSAATVYYPCLSSYALELINIPVSLKVIDFLSIKNVISQPLDDKKILTTLKLSLLLND